MTALNANETAEGAAQGKESLQLIDGHGTFNGSSLDSFVQHVKLAECGLSYAVVAIMGPQSSGKSTLLNHLFNTNFREMDAFTGRSQTTRGVWLARAAGIHPCTLVMDLEGTDGRERGEDDTSFEKQSALFALAVSDIVLINMWCHDIGREQAANKPLLKVVFQVMMRLFTPRKTTLLFVIRDKTRTPMDILERILREDVQKIWESAPKPPNYQGTDVSDCFNVQVTALASYEEKPEVFRDQVADLRERFNNSIAPGGLAGDRRAVVPGTGFPVSSRSIWQVIKENKDLDLPAHKVMVATVRCEEIAHEKLREFLNNQEWVDLNESTKTRGVAAFGAKVNTLLYKYMSEYDLEVSYFDENVRTAKRNYLLSQVLEAVYPAYQAVVSHHRVEALNRLKQDLKLWDDSSDQDQGFASAVRQFTQVATTQFDEAVKDSRVSYAQWDSSKPRERLRKDIDTHAAAVRAEKIGVVVSSSERRLEENVGASTGALLDTAAPDTWISIRNLLSHEIESSQSGLLTALSGYELDESEKTSKLDGVANFARTVVENEARKEAAQALLRMKDRFTTSFSHDAESLPRMWSDKDDVRAIARDARSASLKGLSVLAAIRLDEKSSDRIEPALASLLGDSQDGTLSKSLGTMPDSESSSILVSNPLAANSWDGVATDSTLLTPVQCKSIWRQFKAETDYIISQALAAQEANKKGKSWMPPPWAIAAIILLGFNEFMALLKNPLYLLIGFVCYLLGKALWVQLDVGAEFQHGVMPGVLGITSKLLPTVMNFLTRLAEEGSKVGESNQRYNSTSPSTRTTEMQDFAQGSETINGRDSKDSGGSVRNRQTRTAALSS